MFTIENFVTGLQSSVRNLLVNVESEKIILSKVFYNYDRAEEEHKIIGEIPIADINSVTETLTAEFSCFNSVLCGNRYFEVAVQAVDQLRRPPFRPDLVTYSVSEHNYEFELSRASSRYIFALFCSFSQRAEQNYQVRPLLLHMLSQEKLSSLNDLTELFRILTVKINTPKMHSNSELRRMFDSYLFNISYNHNTTLSVMDFIAEQRPFRNGSRRNGQLFPYRHYNPELVKYYHQAVAINIPFAQYLAFYHVAEFFFQSISEKDTFCEIENYITRPSFSPHRESDIRGFYNMIRKKMREQREDGVWNEKTGLLLCMKKYIPDLSILKDSILSINPNALFYYKTSLVEFTDDSKLIDFNDTSETIYQNIRDRVYSVRNAIVHSKDGEKLRYEPFKHDNQLTKEIPLIRSIAEEIIMNSAKQFDFF